MAIMRVACPECGASLKSADGFEVGQEIECPKCDTAFAVEKPAKAKAAPIDDGDDQPKKKKKKKVAAADDDYERSYKTSPARYAVLGVLVVTMLVLGYFLVKKWQDEKKTVDSGGGDGGGSGYKAPPPQDSGADKIKLAGPVPPGFGKDGGTKKGGNTKTIGPVVAEPKGGNPPKIDVAGGPPSGSGFLGMDLSAAEKDKVKQQALTKLLGTWKADLGGGATMTITYTKDGKFTETVTGPAARETTGTWQAADAIGTKGVYLTRTGGGAREVKATFEGDELIHETGEMGVTAVFRKS